MLDQLLMHREGVALELENKGDVEMTTSDVFCVQNQDMKALAQQIEMMKEAWFKK